MIYIVAICSSLLYLLSFSIKLRTRNSKGDDSLSYLVAKNASALLSIFVCVVWFYAAVGIFVSCLDHDTVTKGRLVDALSGLETILGSSLKFLREKLPSGWLSLTIPVVLFFLKIAASATIRRPNASHVRSFQLVLGLICKFFLKWRKIAGVAVVALTFTNLFTFFSPVYDKQINKLRKRIEAIDAKVPSMRIGVRDKINQHIVQQVIEQIVDSMPDSARWSILHDVHLFALAHNLLYHGNSSESLLLGKINPSSPVAKLSEELSDMNNHSLDQSDFTPENHPIFEHDTKLSPVNKDISVEKIDRTIKAISSSEVSQPKLLDHDLRPTQERQLLTIIVQEIAKGSLTNEMRESFSNNLWFVALDKVVVKTFAELSAKLLDTKLVQPLFQSKCEAATTAILGSTHQNVSVVLRESACEMLVKCDLQSGEYWAIIVEQSGLSNVVLQPQPIVGLNEGLYVHAELDFRELLSLGFPYDLACMVDKGIYIKLVDEYELQYWKEKSRQPYSRWISFKDYLERVRYALSEERFNSHLQWYEDLRKIAGILAKDWSMLKEAVKSTSQYSDKGEDQIKELYSQYHQTLDEFFYLLGSDRAVFQLSTEPSNTFCKNLIDAPIRRCLQASMNPEKIVRIFQIPPENIVDLVREIRIEYYLESGLLQRPGSLLENRNLRLSDDANSQNKRDRIDVPDGRKEPVWEPRYIP